MPSGVVLSETLVLFIDSYDKIYKLNEKDASALVLFYGKSCGKCRRIGAVVESQSHVSGGLGDAGKSMTYSL